MSKALNVAICQINPSLGSFENNLVKIGHNYEQAIKKNENKQKHRRTRKHVTRNRYENSKCITQRSIIYEFNLYRLIMLPHGL